MDTARMADIIRRAHLVSPAYRVATRLDTVRNYADNRRFRVEHPDFAVPPPSLTYLTARSTSYENYLRTGAERARFLTELAGKANPPEVRRILEWGCGTGKTVRHLAADPLFHVSGTDYDERVIRWCRENIRNVSFAVNDVEPPLPFDDDHFDMLYSYSVYTHLPPELQFRWLAEQLRVVRPGGLVLLSVHGDAYKHRLTPAEREQYDSDGVVVHGGMVTGGPWFTSFNSPRWMEEEFLRDHDIVYREIYPEGGPTQDVWVVRSPNQ